MSVSSTHNGAVFTSRLVETVGKVNAAMDLGIGTMGIDMLRLVKIQAPHDKGGLANRATLRRRGLKKYRIIVDIAYARRWEFNEDIVDRLGRHFGPATFKQGKKSRYVRDPAQLIARQAPRYLRDAANTVGA